MGSVEQLASLVLSKADDVYPVNITALINRMGIEVYFCPFSDSLNGFYTKVEGCPIIAINSIHSVKRQRFTAAHELYHHVAESSGLQFSSSMSRVARERRADCFAAAVLMPINECMYLTRRGMTYVNFASIFKVSKQAAMIRAIEVNRIMSFGA